MKKRATNVAYVNPGIFWSLDPDSDREGANHADLHIQKLMRGKTKGIFLRSKFR